MPVSKTKDRSSLFSLTLMLELREERTKKNRRQVKFLKRFQYKPMSFWS